METIYDEAARMQDLTQAINAWSDERLAGMRRGVEKESLRTRADGHLVTTAHPRTLGSALTHPHITTDFFSSNLCLFRRKAYLSLRNSHIICFENFLRLILMNLHKTTRTLYV